MIILLPCEIHSPLRLFKRAWHILKTILSQFILTLYSRFVVISTSTCMHAKLLLPSQKVSRVVYMSTLANCVTFSCNSQLGVKCPSIYFQKNTTPFYMAVLWFYFVRKYCTSSSIVHIKKIYIQLKKYNCMF